MWCPQCGAEYLAGIAECHKCGVALVEERPPLVPLPWPVTIMAARVAPILAHVRALTYAREAHHLLRRRPALLLLPIAIAVFNAAELGVGSYLSVTQTAFGRRALASMVPGQSEASRKAQLRAELSPAAWAHNAALQSPLTFATPIPYLELSGVQGLVWTAVIPAKAEDFPPLRPAQTLVLAVHALLMLPLAALVLSGYYRRLLEAIPASSPAGLQMRQRFAGFLWYLTLVYVATNAGLVWLLAVPSGVCGLTFSLLTWGPRVFGVLVALTPVALASDDAPFLSALKRGVRTVVRGWPTTLALLLMLFLGSAIAVALRGLLGAAIPGLHALPPTPASTLTSVAVQAGYQSALALLGVWLCLAQFLWYRDANPVPAAIPEEAEA